MNSDLKTHLWGAVSGFSGTAWRRRCAVQNEQKRERRAMMKELTKHLRAIQ